MNKNIKIALAFSMSLFMLGCSTAGSWMDMSSSFSGWRQLGDANWRIEGDEFVADSGNGQLVTQESFDDFQITLEFWTDEGANSGVFMRISDPNAIADSSAYEANIFDNRPDQSGRTGGIVNHAPPSEVINTPNQWNTYDITMLGDDITVVLNGVTTVDFSDDTYSSGPLSLQYGAGVVKFRNVQIRRL